MGGTCRSERQVERGMVNEIALLTRLSLHDEILGTLREMIVTGDLRAGACIAEPALCHRLGISRTPLREALKVLAFDGWVELVPNRGAIVTRITPDEVASLFELLEGLEQFTGELAAARATAEDFREIRALHDVMVEHYERGDPSAYFAVNQQIHHRLAQATHNPALVATHENLSRKVLRARAMANLLTERQEASFSEHAAILAALERRDGALLGRLLRSHLHDAGEAVHTALIRRSRPAAARKPTSRRLRA
jgi:DNA-binding GntR family transcriptional regulator